MFCLPRSRSQWMAAMMAKMPGVTAWHDPSKDCETPTELTRKVETWLANNSNHLFIADTAALMFHTQICAAFPDMTDIYMHRKVEDVRASVLRQTGYDWATLINPMYERMATLRALNTGLFFEFDDFGYTDLALVANLCTNKLDFPIAELKKMCNTVIDVPVHEQISYPEKTKSLISYRET